MPHFSAKGYPRLLLALLALLLCGCSADAPAPPYAGDATAPPRAAAEAQADRAPLPAPPAAAYPGAAREEEVKIALLLPISGQDAALGRALLDAATLALYDKYAALPEDAARARVTLLPKDTGDSEESAKAAAGEALAEGARLILGPLHSRLAEAVLPLARARGVNVVSFSNNPALAGSGLFQFGYLPDEQVERVVRYAWKNGYDSFAAMAPDTPYGQQVTRAFSRLVSTRGGPAHPLETYPPGASNLPYQTVQAARAMLQGAAAGRQAMFLPERGKPLEEILGALLQKREELSARHFKLLGTGLWDDDSSLALRGLHGAWFASSPPAQYRQFEQHFAVTYGYRPQRLASLAYDAAALAAAMAMAPGGVDFSADALTLPGGYSGPAGGVFRFLPDGLCERSLAVMEITPRGFKVIDAAPLGFMR